MAYSDYGAFVYLNGERRRDKEDVAVFATDEEIFGIPSHDIPSGARIWMSVFHAKENNQEINWITSIHHGIMGDGNVRVMCHKQGLPSIYEATEAGINEIIYCDEDTDRYEYDINFEYKGYKFKFESYKPYYAEMITPSGDVWVCKYDYGYGAGYEIM